MITATKSTAPEDMQQSGKEEVTEETTVCFRNSKIPNAADEKSNTLAAVCCPAFSLD